MSRNRNNNRNSEEITEKEESTMGNRSNSNRNSNRRGGSKPADPKRKFNGAKDNDVSWWNGAGQLFMDATNISTFDALGARHNSALFNTQYYSPTGVARFDYLPFFGDVESSTHPINTTAKIMYDVINAKNSRNPSYDPSDLMIYVIAVAQAWSLHAWVQRICGMFGTFSVINRYWWLPITESMGIAPISTDNDIVKWRNLANYMSVILNRLAVPIDIPYFARTQFMSESIYQDQNIGKSTYYYFSPAALFKYQYDTEVTTQQIGMLGLVKTPWYEYLTGERTDPVTPKDVEAYFFNIIENLFNDSDINTMGADIVKAFGQDHLYQLPQIGPDYIVAPGYSEEVNMQLHNARMLYSGANIIGGNRPYQVKQDMITNTLKTTRVIWDMPGSPSTALMATDMTNGRQIAFDFHYDSPTNEAWMVSSRLCWFASEPDAAHLNDYAKITACTEVLIGDSFYEFQTDENGDWTLNHQDNCCIVTSTGTLASQEKMIPKLARVSKLHDAPITFFVRPNGNSAQFKDPVTMAIISDLTNYTTISCEDLRNMHDVAILSVFLPAWLRSYIDGRK